MASRRTLSAALLATGLALGTAGGGLLAAAPPASTVITITAHRFAYEPNLITVKKGQKVTIEISSSDRLHGFVLAAFGIRLDASPDGKNRVTFTPQQTGTFLFHCDVFCGDGHEDMEGHLVVVD
jgi:cytochrome c oxidase subunit 2